MSDFLTGVEAIWVIPFVGGLMWLVAGLYVRATSFDPMRSVRNGRKRGASNG